MSYIFPANLSRIIQGNILKPHDRKFVTFLFFHWPAKQSTNQYRAWVKEMSKEVTSHERQRADSLRYKEALANGVSTANLPQSFVINIGLTYQAYLQMGYESHLPPDRYLKQGMLGKEFFPNYNNGLHVYDPLARFFRERPAHHVIMSIAHDHSNQLQDKVEEIRLRSLHILPDTDFLIKQVTPIRATSTSGSQKGEALGPFGFRDGISNPRTVSEAAEFAFGTADTSELQKRSQLGTYFAFQKIICRVGKFNLLSRKLRDTINTYTPKKITTAQAQALLIGRHRKGAPLDRFHTAPRRQLTVHELQEFDYTEPTQGKPDDQGARCPLHAHTRRVNPRQGGVQLTPIIRRGVTYRERNKKGQWQQSLLFLSMQSSLEHNLVPLYNSMFVKRPQDAVTYSGPSNQLVFRKPKLTYYLKYDDPQSPNVDFDHIGREITNFVTGAFYYLPDLNFLQQLEY